MRELRHLRRSVQGLWAGERGGVGVAPGDWGRSIAAAVVFARGGVGVNVRVACVAARDTAAHLPDLFDVVQAVWRLWVLVLDVQVEVSSKRRRGERLSAVGAHAVFARCRL